MSKPKPAFREVPYMGVIYVVAEAMKRGFTNGHPDWCNLGQGQPEVGSIEGAPTRISTMEMEPIDQAYGPVGGTRDLREAVAEHYNRLFRTGHRSRYRAENVAIAAGGRLALSRLLAALGNIRVGYQTPDYTAYGDLLAYHAHRSTPVQVPTRSDEGFKVSPARFAQLVLEQEFGAYLVSNPCNPTGVVLEAEELQSYVHTASRQGCTLLLDEFYSHFIYREDGAPGNPVSAASYVEDVDHDRVIIVDGLTKNFRYPGWRVGWVLGPAELVEQVIRTASAIDGGPPTAVQRAAIAVLAPARADQETRAVREVFARKRRILLDGLQRLGVRFPHPSLGTFYLWGDLSGLPQPYSDADCLFERALEHRVMIVPGRFFDVNPGNHRPPDPEYRHWVRFSFGPPEDNVRLGVARLAQVMTGSRPCRSPDHGTFA